MRRLGKKKVKLGFVWVVLDTIHCNVVSEGYKSEKLAQEEVDILNALQPGSASWKKIWYVK